MERAGCQMLRSVGYGCGCKIEVFKVVLVDGYIAPKKSIPQTLQSCCRHSSIDGRESWLPINVLA